MEQHQVSLPKVQTRKEFIECLESMIQTPKEHSDEEESRGRPRELKTYVLESDGDFPLQHNSDDLEWTVSDTGLDDMKILHVERGFVTCEFFLDLRDRRFLTLHTNDVAEDANNAIKELVRLHSHAFDTAWFHSDLLRKFSRDEGNIFRGFEMSYSNRAMRSLEHTDSDIEDLKINMSGSLAEKIERILENKNDIRKRTAYTKVKIKRGRGDDPSRMVHDDIDKAGYFAVKKGKSVDGHLQLVDMCREKYAQIVRDIEKMCIGVSESRTKAIFEGHAFEFRFSDTIENFDHFINNVFNSRAPFRLWGLKKKIYDGYFKVAAVDLHTGSTMNFDVAADTMRAYIYKGGCGNTIMRLLTNLQQYYDSKTRCLQLEALID